MTFLKTTINNGITVDFTRAFPRITAGLTESSWLSPAHVLVKYPKSFSQHFDRMAEPKD